MVLAIFEKEPAGWRRERLLAVKLGLEGEMSMEQIAKSLSRARSTIQLWFDAYRKGGVEGLLMKRKGNGPASMVPPEVSALLVEK